MSADGASERWVERWLRDARRCIHAVRLVAVLVILLVMAVTRRRESTEASDWRSNAPAITLVALAAGVTFALTQRRKFRVRLPAELARDFPIGSAEREALLARLAPGNVARRDAAGARMLRAYALAAEAGSLPTDPRAPTPARSTEVAGAFATVVARLRAREADPWSRPGAAIAAWLRDWRGPLFVALVGFTLSKISTSWRTLALELAAVAVVHELGHVLTMRTLGCRNARVLFLPFFAAFVKDKPNRSAAWKRGLVLLMGPAPGIVIGAWLALSVAPSAEAAQVVPASLARLFLWFNLVQLLPFPGMDGGRLLQLTFPRPHPGLEYTTRWIAAFAIGGYLDHVFRRLTPRPSWTLTVSLGAFLGLWLLASAASALRVARAARQLSARGFPRCELSDLPDHSLSELFAVASTRVVWLRANRIAEIERTMRAIHERATEEGARPLHTCGIAAAVCVLAALVFLGLAAA